MRGRFAGGLLRGVFYARVSQPERLVRVPAYRPTLVDPYRDHLRRRREADPAAPVLELLTEIRSLGYTGSQNLLYRYITQGRVEADRLAVSPRRLTSMILTRPAALSGDQRHLLNELTTTCPEMNALVGLVGSFAALLTPAAENVRLLDTWIADARAADLPHLHAFTRGIDFDYQAVQAAVTLSYHNGGTEGVNTKTKRIMRQMHGRAGFHLLRHRIRDRAVGLTVPAARSSRPAILASMTFFTAPRWSSWNLGSSGSETWVLDAMN